MSSEPFQPIPESTQVHVDRLLGAQVGEYQVKDRLSEGRLGTLYRAHQSATGKPVTIEALRAERIGNDEEARAANAIGNRGIATVLGFGELPDGRRYRVMENLEGESLDQVVRRRGRLPPAETSKVLDQVAVVLEAAHAWGIVHGNLGASSVFVVGAEVKLLDFGLANRPVTPQADLAALGALGFTLLSGRELRDGAPPALSSGIPELFDRFLRELIEQRIKNATEVRKELTALFLDAPVIPPTRPKRSRVVPLVAFAGVVTAAIGAALFFWPPEPAAPVEVLAPVPEEEADVLVQDEPPETQPTEPGQPRLTPTVPRAPKGVPTAQALYEQSTRLEGLLRKRARPGDDIQQALFVLNKLRLRLSGSPSVEDRKEVAHQLAGWRRSYLRP